MAIKLDRTIYNGSEEAENRLDKEVRSYQLLERLGIPFVRLDHEAAATIDDCDEINQLLNINICKNLFLCNTQKTNFYLLILPGNKKFVTKLLSAQLGCARLSFADYSFMEEFLDITPGSVSIMGLMNDTDNRVQLLIDKDLLKDEYFGCHPCINTTSLRIKTSDIIEKLLPAINHSPIFVEMR